MENNKGFFPMFVDISSKKIVVVGAGRVALRRIKTLLLFAKDILVIAPDICEEILEMADMKLIKLRQKPYDNGDLQDAWIVLAATDSPVVNHEIFCFCRSRGILINVASDRNKCDFHFPGIVRKDEVVIGIHAGGYNHRKVKEIREELEELYD